MHEYSAVAVDIATPIGAHLIAPAFDFTNATMHHDTDRVSPY